MINRISFYLNRLRNGTPLSPSTTSYIRFKEIIGIIALLITVAGVFHLYVQKISPLRLRIQTLTTQFQKLRTDIDALQVAQMKEEEAVKNIEVALEKLENFEQTFLLDYTNGQVKLIDEINEIANKNGVQLISGITFEATQTELPSVNSSPGKGFNSKDINFVVYPAITFKFDIAGSYDKLCKFLKSVEQSKQFLLLKVLQLQTDDSSTKRAASSSKSDIVTIKTEITAYFRPNK